VSGFVERSRTTPLSKKPRGIVPTFSVQAGIVRGPARIG
jgi:hypothetical protein